MKRLAMNDTESKSLIQDEDKRPVECARNIADGYVLVPLKQRHVFLALGRLAVLVLLYPIDGV